jgi:hypothetical protein
MISRRGFFRISGAAAALPLLPSLTRRALAASPVLIANFGTLITGRPTEILRAAANRIIPPFDNGTLSFAGAGNQGTVEYVLTLLTAFDYVPPRIYPSTRAPGDPSGSSIGSPLDLSECKGGHLAVPGGWIDMPPEKELGWRQAIARFQETYLFGLGKADAQGNLAEEGQLDQDSKAVFGVGFLELPLKTQQTLLLEAYDAANNLSRVSGVYSAGEGEAALQPTYGSSDPRATFLAMLFVHTMEAIYGDPIYRGADPSDRAGWKLVGFGGPRHPGGYGEEDLETLAPCDFGYPLNSKFPENL